MHRTSHFELLAEHFKSYVLERTEITSFLAQQQRVLFISERSVDSIKTASGLVATW